ncbi:MAG: thymidine phosphorylase [candidate division Zixibacteria bacterium]|nr:thymidine phosphorylase [candidate division Zixibacteria bacterium]
MMNPVEIISAKRNGKELSAKEIKYFVDNYTSGDIPDYQMAAFLMAVYFNSMTADETAALTAAMLESGDRIVFDPQDKLYIDKHSSGGIGDKVSIILAPLMAACGLKVPMLSGRGLGHTGGTLDKLESITGFRTDLSIEEFKSGVDSIGCIITGQTPQIAPADRKMYALRDVTGTVESIPLICGSILSKKFAAGTNSIVFDIKCGNGAFMKTVEQANHLGQSLCDICDVMHKGAVYLITDMNQPLGNAVGNALEIDESIAALHGGGPDDLMQVVFSLGESMLKLGGIAFGEDALRLQKEKIDDGSAFEIFLKMVSYQGGDTVCLEKGKPLKPAEKIFDATVSKSGYIKSIDTYQLGQLIIKMGGGRTTVGQPIDHSVGFIIHKKIADYVDVNDTLMQIHSNGQLADDYLKQSFAGCFEICEQEMQLPVLITK